MASRSELLGTTYKCLRLPANGSPIDRLDYTTTSSIPKGPDTCWDFAADFRRYWQGDYLSREVQSFRVDEHPIPALDGEYILYYSTDSSRPVNRTVLSMPAVHDAVEKSTNRGEKFEERLFYRGDVFVVRLKEWGENNGYLAIHEDISPEAMQPVVEILGERLIACNWEDRFLEYQHETTEYDKQFMQRHESHRAGMMSHL
jgi:hypothetical protein